VLAPLVFALLEDSVSVVRDAAVPSFAPLLDRFADAHPEW
jgi:hypothetical protein